MQFFYVLVNGVTFKIASKLVKQSYKYHKTINRRYNKWVKDKIFSNIHDLILNQYKSMFKPEHLTIDSTDIVNGNCPKKIISRSFKLHKQALRLTVITDEHNVPLNRSIDKPIDHDSQLGINLLVKTNVGNEKQIYVPADKGYIVDKNTQYALLQSKGFRLVTPKKKYKKKIYKTPNYKPKRQCIRHSKQMKNILKKRIYIEHFNSVYHRSYKRLNKLYDRSLATINGFIDLAFTVIIIKAISDRS